MLVENLQRVCKAISKVSNATSITPLYRSVEIGPGSFRACSEYGNIECWLDGTGVEPTCMINAANFASVVNGLAPKAEITLKKTENQVRWKSGEAQGYWVLVDQDNKIPLIEHTNFKWTPPKEFSKALILAGAACQATTVAVGLYGVVIETVGDTIRLLSSNSISLACATVAKCDYSGPKVTLRPPVPAIFSSILEAGGTVSVDITESGVYILGDWLVAHLPLSAPLDHDLEATLNRFPDNNFPVAIDSAAIKKFLGRAKLLADKGQPINVMFQVKEGKLLLEHKSLSSASEEYFLAAGLDSTWSFSSVNLPVDLLLTSMEHVKSASLDHLSKNILVLRGEAPEFRHIVGGQTKK